MGTDFTFPGFEMDDTFQTLKLRLVNENRMRENKSTYLKLC